MRCMGTTRASNWMNYLCTAANTTWLSLPRNTSGRPRGAGGLTLNIVQNKWLHGPKCWHFKRLPLVADCCLHFHHSDPKAKKGKEGRDPADMVKFSKVKPEVKPVRQTCHIFCVPHISHVFCICVLLLNNISWFWFSSLRSKSLWSTSLTAGWTEWQLTSF